MSHSDHMTALTCKHGYRIGAAQGYAYELSFCFIKFKCTFKTFFLNAHACICFKCVHLFTSFHNRWLGEKWQSDMSFCFCRTHHCNDFHSS